MKNRSTIQKVAIESKKVTIGDEKVAIDEEKVAFERCVSEMTASAPTQNKAKLLLALTAMTEFLAGQR